MNRIYTYVCYEYFLFTSNPSIDSLEKILFLIQVDSLEKDDRPFIKSKIYINGMKIRITYISDLLRVSPITEFGYDSLYINPKMDIYLKRMKKYSKLNDVELQNAVNKVLNTKRLDGKYFTHDTYKNNLMRKWARLKLMGKNHRVLEMFRAFFEISICFPLYICTLIFLFSYLISGNGAIKEKLFQLIGYTALFNIPYLIWMWIWMKPTKYEIEKGYEDN